MQNVIMELGIVAATLAAVTGIGAFAMAMYKVAKRIESAIGVDEKGRTLSERMDKVEYQLWENGGSSLADRVNRVDANSKESAAEVRIIKSEVTFIKDVMLQLIAMPESHAHEETSKAKK